MITALVLTQLAQAAPTFDLGAYTGVTLAGPNHELYDPTLTHRGISPGGTLGLRAAWVPMDLIAAEGEVHGVLAGIQDSGIGMLQAYRLHAQLRLPVGPEELTPFLVAGGGSIGVASGSDALGNDLDWAQHTGAGALYQLNERMLLRADLRYLLTSHVGASKKPGGTTEFLVGLSTRIGGEPTVVDLDMDGVPDDLDQCPTEMENMNGVEDGDGCPDRMATLRVKVIDPDEWLVPGAKVAIDGKSYGPTDFTGEVTINEERMPGTAASLVVTRELMNDATINIDSLAAAENEVEARLTWKPGSTRVVAKDDTGKPIPAGVGFIGDSDIPAVVLGPDGDEIFTLPPGNWTVLVSAEGYGVEKEDILISPDSESLVVVKLTMKVAEVEVTKEEVKILQRILFEVDGDQVSAGSSGIVEEVAATLLANPQIRKVEVQGHTDNTGKASYNQDLSQRRVNAVMQMLIDQGVAADRLEAKGYGQSKPIADNGTDEGREQNRRVQFVILEQDE